MIQSFEKDFVKKNRLKPKTAVETDSRWLGLRRSSPSFHHHAPAASSPFPGPLLPAAPPASLLARDGNPSIHPDVRASCGDRRRCAIPLPPILFLTIISSFGHHPLFASPRDSSRHHSGCSRSIHATMMHMTYYNSADVTLLLNSWTTGGDQSYYAICMLQRIVCSLCNAARAPCSLSWSNPTCSSHRHLHHIIPLRVFVRLCQQVLGPSGTNPPTTHVPFSCSSSRVQSQS